VGFVASDNLILTCAHVIAQASRSEDKVHFDLPLLAPGESFSGRVSFRDDEQYIATIEATGLPDDAAPVGLVQTDELWKNSFRAFGVPQGHDGGVWASGVFRDQNAQGWLHIEDVKTTGFAIQPGFSGGPVWDENLNAVVGMVVAAERDPLIKAVFCIPVEKLSEAVPELKAQPIPSNPLSRTVCLPRAMSIYANVIFVVLWIGFITALAVNRELLDVLWNWVQALPMAPKIIVWVLIFPIMVGLWIWESSWSALVQLVGFAGIVAWTLLAVSSLYKAFR
jgi:hypothetical protein